MVRMSGHSKWHSIRHAKGATDKRRGQLFSKLTRAIIVAAREGGPDSDANLALRNAVEKAREASMPKDNIERAIARGSGAGDDGSSFEHIIYEGYGPGGVAVLVEAQTDNRNRTAAEVRSMFTKSGIMVGLGEDKAEVYQVMDDLRAAEVDFLTIGQYLQPHARRLPVERYVTPPEFDRWRDIGMEMGFHHVQSSPLTRSSYHAREQAATS